MMLSQALLNPMSPPCSRQEDSQGVALACRLGDREIRANGSALERMRPLGCPGRHAWPSVVTYVPHISWSLCLSRRLTTNMWCNPRTRANMADRESTNFHRGALSQQPWLKRASQIPARLMAQRWPTALAQAPPNTFAISEAARFRTMCVARFRM